MLIKITTNQLCEWRFAVVVVLIIFNSPITVEKHTQKNNTIATAKKRKNTYTYTVHSPQ